MAYQDQIPQPIDELKTSQNDILNNFIAIKAAWDVNHVTFDLANQGKHNYVTLPEQAGDPTTSTDEVALYSKESALTGKAELFIKKETPTGDVIEFTSAIKATPGWTRLPSGILLKWGAATATGAGTIIFPVGATIPAFTTVFSAQLTVLDATAADADEAIRLTAFTAASISVWGSPRSTTGSKAVNFEYLVIGE